MVSFNKAVDVQQNSLQRVINVTVNDWKEYMIPKNNSSYLPRSNAFFVVQLVEDEKASHPRIL